MPRPKGANHFAWKGGRKMCLNGYVEILKPGHPMAKRNYVLEHRFVMSEFLGRPLTTDEHVHHINGDKLDNSIENLQLVSNAEHGAIHCGWNHLDETKEKMRQYASNRTEEHLRKIGLGLTGREVSEATRLKISQAKRGKKTVPCSPEKKARLRALALERHAKKLQSDQE